MDFETLGEAVRNRRPAQTIPTAIERWLLPILRSEVSKSGLPSFIGASIESINFEGTYPETRIVTRLRLGHARGDDRMIGFPDELWFTDDDGQPLEGESLIEAVQMQPFVDLYMSSLDAAVGHFRSDDRLIPRRIERDGATGRDVEWIDFPVDDAYGTSE